MKILEPQSAVLTNAEVLTFLNSHPPRRPRPPVGGYVGPDLQGLYTVVKELNDYATRIAPHLRTYPSDPPSWLPVLLRRLKPWNLTKAEVLMILNLGIGVPQNPTATAASDSSGATSQEQQVPSVEGGGEEEPGEGGLAGLLTEEEEESARALLHEVVEELEERLEDADVKKILRVMAQVIGRGKGEESRQVDGLQGGEENGQDETGTAAAEGA